MYSSVYDEIVIVKAPVMFVMADNPAHSDICGLLQQTTQYACRKCYFPKVIRRQKQTVTEANVSVEQLNGVYVRRTREHYAIAASDADRSKPKISDVLEGGAVSASDLSFKNTGSDAMLQLTSYDPSLDTPVEVLHCISLGIGKYLIEHLVKVVLAGKTNEPQMDRLVKRLSENQSNKAYARTFRKHLRHVGSFLGRDFKQLMQILPPIIADEFTDPITDKNLLLLNESLIVLGKLCSLVFVRQVESDFDAYVESIKATVEDLTAKMLDFDRATNNSKPFCTRPKVHYLHHLHEDIRRFGCALHFETEKGEMFNKFIREQLFHTNRGKPSRDVALRFSKQAILKHVVDGGSWVNSKGRRVKYGSDIEAFVKSDETIFRKEFFGAREFAENNHTTVDTNPSPGFKGVFKTIEVADGDGAAYSFVGVLDGDGRVEECDVFAKDNCGRLECQATGKTHAKDKLLALGVLDMAQSLSNISIPATTSVSSNKICYKLNLNKFGTITLLKSNGIFNSF